PEYCLRVLCLYRFLNPDAEIRVAGGREMHLRSMEVMALYPANSLFVDGYLNAKGTSRIQVLRMIKDAGFTIKADQSLEELLEQEKGSKNGSESDNQTDFMKDIKDLRPKIQLQSVVR
ncbi:MAG: biotin synthase BioB, partial [Candidatus Poribacteria bacterium]